MGILDPQTKPDLFIIRGDTYNIDFTAGMDITGGTVFFTAKPTIADEANDTTAVITVEVTDHSDPTNGVTVIPLSSSDTNIDPGEYFYDIQIKVGSTVTSIPVRKLKVYGDVTRRTS